ncbi:MAG TPA: VOC family protein [Cyclobacteriaceae bacterium]|nr:VOC family protein [Cyclobacteriaceae bacterium]
MEIRSTVIAIPVQDLGKSVSFYTQIFGLKTQIEEGMAIIELPNLSLFLMEKEAFEVYSQKAGRPALFPSAGVPAIFSCALVSKEAVDKALEDAPQYGGKREAKAAIDPSFGGYIGYLADPDGHLWELVFPLQQKDQ